MELKEYQARALEAFCRWRDALAAAQEKASSDLATLREVGAEVSDNILNDLQNYPKSAWRKLAQSGGVAATGEYINRTDGAGRPIPHICFKVPTGGGKTLLAAAALERLNRQSGLTLWITPTRAIYQQTKTALWNREHPYRQMLERASGGRVKLLEKDDPFTASDIEHKLCIMLLMLPAANRERERDFLRMNRDSGRYPTLFPDSDDSLGNVRLLEEHPDLDRHSDSDTIKHSLFNVLKMLRPVTVLDEAHKAYGQKQEDNRGFVRSVNQLNPSLVIELSATPNSGISNLLVNITGVELKSEEMIKLPVQVNSYINSDWQHTLAQSHEELERLAAEAQSLESSEGHYIRPIAVVRVERTGKRQRDGERVHAEDVRQYLLQNLGVPADSVVVKSSEVDELGRENLLSKYSSVRWIITKAALMEGWDCPFAYVLVMLDNTKSQRPITQLVGRVMRQPRARRTEREALDRCYVYCCNTEVGVAVDQVKKGLESEGLTGLGSEVVAASGNNQLVLMNRRERFRGRDIFLPKVMHQSREGWCELDYHRHILPVIDWDAIAAPDPQTSLTNSANLQSASVDVDETGTPTSYDGAREVYIDKSVKISWYARRLSDVVPNPWQAARIVADLIHALRSAGLNDARIYDQRSPLAAQLRNHALQEVEKLAEKVFCDKLAKGHIRFSLDADIPSHRIKDEPIEIMVDKNDGSFERRPGQPLQLNLFEPLMRSHFDTDLERNFASYLDEQKALKWWHRVAVRQWGGYYLRGWKPERIWPDFIAMGVESSGHHLLVFETKGEHLRGNPDTDYKRRVLETLQNAYNCGTMTVREGPAKGTFRLVFNREEFSEALADLQYAHEA